MGERGWWRSASREELKEGEKKAFKWIIAAAVVSDQPVPDRDGLSSAPARPHFFFFKLKTKQNL
jgi:hypothetical protein